MPRVVVLGSSGYDLTIRLDRLPRPGETLLGGSLLRGPGGKGANAAIAARRAGAEVVFLTAFGDDDFGRQIAAHDREEGIDLTYAKVADGIANQVALIFVAENGENLIGVAPGASEQLTPEDVDRLPDAVFDPSAVFLACLEVPLATVARALQRAKTAGMTTLLNPAPVDRNLIADPTLPAERRDHRRDILSLVDVLTPNQSEAVHLTGLNLDSAEESAHAANVLRQRHGARQVIVTRGGDGCVVVTEDGTFAITAPSVEVVDTVGAGDAFNGALAVALAEGRPLAESAAWACAAGALAVTRPGAQGALPRRAEIDRLADTVRIRPL